MITKLIRKRWKLSVALSIFTLILIFNFISYFNKMKSFTDNWKTYTNSRFGYSIKHPQTFEEKEEATNNDGKALYKDDKNEVLVYGTYMPSTFSTQDAKVERNEIAITDGQKATRLIYTDKEKVIHYIVFITQGDTQYVLNATITDDFYSKNKTILDYMAKSLSINSDNQNKTQPVDQNQKTENITWLIGNNKIVLQFKNYPYPGGDTSDIMTITATDHPKLFENLDYNVIKITPLNDEARALYLISNVFYQAAGYTLHHAIVIDIWRDGAVQYETSDLNTQGWFHNLTVIGKDELKSTFVYGAYDFCRSCGYYLSEYLSYAGPRKGFLTSNTAHKEEFKKMLDDIKRNNHCAVVAGGEQMSFEEIKKQFGEEYRCKASAANMKMEGINPRQYFALKDKVTRIIKGEELSLLNNDL